MYFKGKVNIVFFDVRYVKSKFCLIFFVKWMLEMELVCLKMGEDVLYFDLLWVNFEIFIVGLSLVLCLGNCFMCLYIDEV